MKVSTLKKYFIFFYLLLFKYRFYNHFFELVFKKIKNILTFYSSINLEKKERELSYSICIKRAISNQTYFKKFENKVDFNDFLNKKNLKKKQFSESYELKGPANLNLLYFCSKIFNAEKILETGVADGWSSFTFLEYLEKKISNNPMLISVDMPYLNKFNPKECGGIILDKKSSKIWTILVKPDKTALREIRKKNIKFDLIHYDSDKSIDGKSYSYPILWKMLNKKGVFISDDIQDNMSFFKFCQSNDLSFDVIKYKNKFQGVIVK